LRDRGALSRIFSYRLGRTEVRRSSILKRSAVIASRLVKPRRSRRRWRPVAFDTGIDDGKITGDDTCGPVEGRVALDRHFDAPAEAEAGEFLGDAIDDVRVNRDRQTLLATQIDDGVCGSGGDKVAGVKIAEDTVD
jgi:hypothetical protein